MDLKQVAYDILLNNRRKSGEHQYTVPSPQSYPYQWLWDSCFHAIILSHLSPEDGKKELLSLTVRQFENGMIPHMIYWEKSEAAEHDHLNIAWGRDGTSSITQPPMLAYAAWKIFQKDPDTKFLEKIYPALYHFYKYLLHERDPHERHLIGIINPDESGEDNSPRFDEALDLPPVHDLDENFKRRLTLVDENRKCGFDAPFCMKNFFWVKDVPFNAIMVENLRCLSKIAQKISNGYDAEYFDAEAGRIALAMRELMLEDGIFWSTRGEHYDKIKIKTWAMFAPLFAKIPTQEEARFLVEKHLKNENEFSTTFLLPTVSADEPSFNPDGFWRGPVWISVNWFVFHGLRNYGFDELANTLASHSLNLLEKSGFREHFHPYTGGGYGAINFTWGGLVLDMMES
ncbi:MAG: Trehalase-like protein [Candidatus Kaiserbacteria bacterium GW2011_GWC2_49_12]|uniref:Trehalase-like protein n=4 Tax=Candidatus Kaiseribacteriota TaxID=1752734 RepID=A0A0G1WGI0_9BACT|nr:MAG: Trehalase-like protein [Candidatus Kaiserbacteria bacterium GW2011_GWC2_49_12]KKW17903.1 MAG: Trehalase-like protein [Candidatus Kaiserbacteria bacterium GW2011_GWB1_50_17]KKW18524.1 MAG: Trehalase-like protein [Candidatus Kaiserbacteria bacterium GW2011_GWA1_50_28]OGG86492.1 MAG: hypothetical protein A3H15_02335 [Candidatus Kaiserbacteria bacterium RIFCSPLOWO2_12_FULL_50_28]HCM43763.1 hypothetical protein [Candidatus Kaiserbacteria bacterium]